MEFAAVATILLLDIVDIVAGHTALKTSDAAPVFCDADNERRHIPETYKRPGPPVMGPSYNFS